ncbi:hypothetical protein EAI_12841, partial [Harpegnathos saltator]
RGHTLAKESAKVILFHDKCSRPHVPKGTKEVIFSSAWEDPPHPAYSDLVPSHFYL